MAYSATLRGCDVVYAGSDFVLDATPASVLLISLLNNRRAHTDDTWPAPVPDWANPSSLTARGGWCGDALDPSGNLAGSRLWEAERRVANEETRQDVQDYVVEAVQPLESWRGYALRMATQYLAPTILAYRVQAGSTTVQLTKALS
ncbi:phage GP46 family protein [Acidocella sp.]|uniref:phage GP46 family protein n=1 Tax=Acidocella sp. TaxID=50710 RepID=UPI00260A08CB|nr:phage GP46 family protein [Acidocella sp.]